jgi:hypothetical protein
LLDTQFPFPYIAIAKERQSEGNHPPDGKGCDGIERILRDGRSGPMIEMHYAAVMAVGMITAEAFFSFGPMTSPDHIRYLPGQCG